MCLCLLARQFACVCMLASYMCARSRARAPVSMYYQIHLNSTHACQKYKRDISEDLKRIVTVLESNPSDPNFKRNDLRIDIAACHEDNALKSLSPQEAFWGRRREGRERMGVERLRDHKDKDRSFVNISV